MDGGCETFHRGRCPSRRCVSVASRSLTGTDCSFHDGGRISTLSLRGKKEGSHGLLYTERRQVPALSIILPISLSRAECFASLSVCLLAADLIATAFYVRVQRFTAS